MREIIGENLQSFFDNMGITALKAYSGSIGYWSKFEVWGITEDDYAKICDMSEDEYERVAAEDSWWRCSNGSIMGIPDTTFEVNGKSMLAWTDIRRNDLYNEYSGLDEEERAEYLDADDYVEFWMPYKYENLLQYLCEELGASTEKNVCALAVDLAKYNDITVAELFKRYGG